MAFQLSISTCFDFHEHLKFNISATYTRERSGCWFSLVASMTKVETFGRAKKIIFENNYFYDFTMISL